MAENQLSNGPHAEARAMRLAGKVAIITGGGAGQGREAARLFSREGARVVVADLAGEAAEETAELVRADGGTAVAVQADVAEPEANCRTVEVATDTYGRLDIFYANAGMVSRGPGGDVGLEAIALETWNRIISVNLTGVFLGCRYAIPEMVKTGGGSVILTASVGALAGTRSHNHAYVAAKSALIGLTRNLAVEYAPSKVRVNCLCPGQIRTAMMEPFYGDPIMRRRFEDLTPMGRFGEPGEIAAAALFLASDESSFVTGAVLVVDGGWTAW